MEANTLPFSLDEVVALVLALYEPRSPDAIARIQESLQQLQKSPAGWQLAQNLLMQPDDKVKFFGALTMIVKLNTESSSLSEEAAQEVLQNLIEWLIVCTENGSGAIVIRKLCSALSTYFIHFSDRWSHCVSHLIHCLKAKSSTPYPDFLANTDDVERSLDGLSVAKLQGGLWFASALAEDVGKIDTSTPKHLQLHKRLLDNSPDVVVILRRCMTFRDWYGGDQSVAAIEEEAIKSYQSWILYVQRTASTNDPHVAALADLIGQTIQCLARESLFIPAADLLSDTLTNYASFLSREHYESLATIFDSGWAQHRHKTLLDGDFEFESVQFGLLMLAFGDAQVQQLMESEDERSQTFLSGLSGLLAAKGYPVAEDRIFVPALEFWSTFVETLIDSTFGDSEGTAKQPWLPKAMSHVMQVVSLAWRKCRFPSIEEFGSWDSTERTGFMDARKDVADLLQSVYTLTGPEILTTFANLLLQYVPTQQWSDIEAAAWCLGALSDCVSDGTVADDTLKQVFASPFMDLLSQTQGRIPIRLLQTGLQLIERYSEYFERHSEYLPAALNLLFSAVADPVLGTSSSKSIATLCSSCRSILTGEVSAFLGHYQTIRTTMVLDSIAEERLVLAIASIIQAIRQEDQRLQAFEQLFSHIVDDVDRSLALTTQPGSLDLSNPLYLRGQVDSDQTKTSTATADTIAQNLSLRALRSLVAAAKGMQATSEGPVDLDSDVHAKPRSERLLALQHRIMGTMIRVQQTFSTAGEVLESICSVLRAGFSETELGPFVLPAQMVTDYFCAQGLSTPRIGLIVNTACSFVSSLGSDSTSVVTESLHWLLPWAVHLLQSAGDPSSDPELSQHGIDFAHRILRKFPGMLLHSSYAEFVFNFTLRVLDGSEPLPKGAAADFWTTFLTLGGPATPLQITITNAMAELGPLIALSLVKNIGGNAARSELDRLSEPLKKLVLLPMAQKWLEAALIGPEFPAGDKVGEDQRRMFAKKVIHARGQKVTNTIVRDFWLVCRGSNFAYAS